MTRFYTTYDMTQSHPAKSIEHGGFRQGGLPVSGSGENIGEPPLFPVGRHEKLISSFSRLAGYAALAGAVLLIVILLF